MTMWLSMGFSLLAFALTWALLRYAEKAAA